MVTDENSDSLSVFIAFKGTNLYVFIFYVFCAVVPNFVICNIHNKPGTSITYLEMARLGNVIDAVKATWSDIRVGYIDSFTIKMLLKLDRNHSKPQALTRKLYSQNQALPSENDICKVQGVTKIKCHSLSQGSRGGGNIYELKIHAVRFLVTKTPTLNKI